MRKENVVDGVQNAPHRSLFHALGLTEEEQKRPLIGIVSSYNEIVPGHMNIDKIVDAVKPVLRWQAAHLLYSCDCCLRWYCYGTYGNEIFSRNP